MGNWHMSLLYNIIMRSYVIKILSRFHDYVSQFPTIMHVMWQLTACNNTYRGDPLLRSGDPPVIDVGFISSVVAWISSKL